MKVPLGHTSGLDITEAECLKWNEETVYKAEFQGWGSKDWSQDFIIFFFYEVGKPYNKSFTTVAKAWLIFSCSVKPKHFPWLWRSYITPSRLSALVFQDIKHGLLSLLEEQCFLPLSLLALVLLPLQKCECQSLLEHTSLISLPLLCNSPSTPHCSARFAMCITYTYTQCTVFGIALAAATMISRLLWAGRNSRLPLVYRVMDNGLEFHAWITHSTSQCSW